jgi:hypothetical protein
MSQASLYSARPFDGSLADLDIEHAPHPMRVIGFVRLEVWRARVDEPYGALLAQSKRNAVGREREDPVRRLDVDAVLEELLITSVHYATYVVS